VSDHDGRGGWTSIGTFDPNGDPESPRSVAMRVLIAKRRMLENGCRLTPCDVAAMICAGYDRSQLEPMFPVPTLERWAMCRDWRAWELLEWTADLGGARNIAALTVIRCGYVEGGWWGGRFMPEATIARWVEAGFERLPSAWNDPERVTRYGPPEEGVFAHLREIQAAPRELVTAAAAAAVMPLELDFESPPGTDPGEAASAGGRRDVPTTAGESDPPPEETACSSST